MLSSDRKLTQIYLFLLKFLIYCVSSVNAAVIINFKCFRFLGAAFFFGGGRGGRGVEEGGDVVCSYRCNILQYVVGKYCKQKKTMTV